MASFKSINVDITQLHFDGLNPRHDPISEEPLIIDRLYAPENVIGLIKHIASNGISPLDRIAVIKHPKIAHHFIVVEGNRRLCALKLLRDPAKAPNAIAQKSIISSKTLGRALPKQLEAILFPDRNSAKIWITLRHEGEQGGAGTKKWTAAQIARNNTTGGQATNPNALALALLDYSVQSGLINETQRLTISITTLTRYLTNPVVRDTLGLDSSKELQILVPQDDFNRVILRFLSDALKGVDGPINSRTDTTQRKQYAQDLRNNGVAPTIRLPNPTTPKIKSVDLNNIKKQSKRHSRNPDDRSFVVPTSFKVSISDRVLKRIFDELRSIEPDQFSFSAAYLLRAFVEQTSVLYAKKFALGHQGELHVIIGRCVTHLESAGLDRKTSKPLKEMSSDKNSRLSPDGLGAWVHGSSIPSGSELKRRWDSIEAGFEKMIVAL